MQAELQQWQRKDRKRNFAIPVITLHKEWKIEIKYVWKEKACKATKMKGVCVDTDIKEACVAMDIKVACVATEIKVALLTTEMEGAYVATYMNGA